MIRFLLGLVCCLAVTPALATEAGWALLRDGGRVVLLRHATAPGVGDPANFDLAKCPTQRNLSARGKQQAEKIGALFAARVGNPERVLTSRYCRARDTARIAFEDTKAEDFPPLDQLPQDEEAALEANEKVLDEIRAFTGSGNMVMVTHLENIRALAGISPREGEAVIVAPSDTGLRVLGRIIFN
ncbi:histidine phosphatase family protein [Arvimicrobium flavum]|uniref:histidine phosphatase family protein n=1 Tax=Arvimicrobium flavum TaxID=3393320 RepID=UPI00237C0448|nr:histidine phosphatase family protein [Mesorhizobium shangrilense]